MPPPPPTGPAAPQGMPQGPPQGMQPPPQQQPPQPGPGQISTMDRQRMQPPTPEIPPLIRRPEPPGTAQPTGVQAPPAEARPELAGGQNDVPQLSKAITDWVNEPSPLAFMAGRLYSANQPKQGMEAFVAWQQEKQKKLELATQSIKAISEFKGSMPPREFNRIGVKLLKATYPFLQSVPDELLKSDMTYEVRTMADQYGNVQANVITVPGQKPEIQKAGTMEKIEGAVGRDTGRAMSAEDYMGVTRAQSTQINLGEKEGYDFRKRNREVYLGRVDKLADKAEGSRAGLLRLVRMRDLLDKGAGGIWGLVAAKATPYLEALGVDVRKYDLQNMKTYEVLAAFLAGGARIQLGMVGQMSDRDMQRLDAVKAGGTTGIEAAKEILESYYKSQAQDILRYNKVVDDIAESDKDSPWRKVDLPKWKWEYTIDDGEEGSSAAAPSKLGPPKEGEERDFWEGGRLIRKKRSNGVWTPIGR